MPTKVKRNKNYDQTYRHRLTFHAAMAKVVGLFGLENVIELDKEQLNADKENRELQKLGDRAWVWYVVDADDSDLALALYSNVEPSVRTSLWFWMEGTDEAFMRRVIALLEGEQAELWGTGAKAAVHVAKKIAEKIVEKEVLAKVVAGLTEDEEDSDYEVEEGQTVVLYDEQIVKLVSVSEDGWLAIKTNGYEVTIRHSLIDAEKSEELEFSEVYDAILEDFDFDNDYLEGEGGDHNIRRWDGRLVKVQDVDGEGFTIQIDGNWIPLGERGKKGQYVNTGSLLTEGVYQINDDVEIDIGGMMSSATVRGANDDGSGYMVEFSDWIDVPESNVSS